MIRLMLTPTLFPYTTLFRSRRRAAADRRRARRQGHGVRRGGGRRAGRDPRRGGDHQDRKSTRLNSSHANISYAVFCLKKKTSASQRKRPVSQSQSCQTSTTT